MEIKDEFAAFLGGVALGIASFPDVAQLPSVPSVISSSFMRRNAHLRADWRGYGLASPDVLTWALHAAISLAPLPAEAAIAAGPCVTTPTPLAHPCQSARWIRAWHWGRNRCGQAGTLGNCPQAAPPSHVGAFHAVLSLSCASEAAYIPQSAAPSRTAVQQLSKLHTTTADSSAPRCLPPSRSSHPASC